MKSITLLVTLIVLVLLLTACTSKSPLEVSCDSFDKEPNQSGEVEVSAGEEFTLVLCSNPTTGFTWSQKADISDPSVVSQVNHVLVPPTGDTPPGAASDEKWTFKALQAGNSTVSLEYSRNWEGGEKGVWTYQLNVVVK
jgi:inhibitor of cysteine peptidase